MNYEQEQINGLPEDEFYKIKIVCGFKDGETKALSISKAQLDKIKEVL